MLTRKKCAELILERDFSLYQQNGQLETNQKFAQRILYCFLRIFSIYSSERIKSYALHL